MMGLRRHMWNTVQLVMNVKKVDYLLNKKCFLEEKKKKKSTHCKHTLSNQSIIYTKGKSTEAQVLVFFWFERKNHSFSVYHVWYGLETLAKLRNQ